MSSCLTSVSDGYIQIVNTPSLYMLRICLEIHPSAVLYGFGVNSNLAR